MLALVLGGGGARGAYQAGALRAIARRHPDLQLPILTGISAGALNTAFLAANDTDLAVAADSLVGLWRSLSPEQVFRVDAPWLVRNVIRWGWRLVSGGYSTSAHPRGMVDTEPLRQLLESTLGDMDAVGRRLAEGSLRAVAVSATSYSTGQSVTWVEGPSIVPWDCGQRRAELAKLDVARVMASASLPLLFPAVHVADDWFGDGGIGMIAPLSPALRMGATHILTISTRRHHDARAPQRTEIHGYPPPAQILGVLYRAVFLDTIDEDIRRLEVINDLLDGSPAGARVMPRPIKLFVLRPSQDLAVLARAYEPNLPPPLRFMTRGLGTRRSASADVLSLLMFQRDYIDALIRAGEQDADARASEIDALLADACDGAMR